MGGGPGYDNMTTPSYVNTVDPINTAALGTSEKTAVFKNGGKDSGHYPFVPDVPASLMTGASNNGI